MRLASVTLTIIVAGCGASPTASTITTGGHRIFVTPQATCPASAAGCDILEILDLHTNAASEDKGFEELRARAVAKGGDAVIGAEFEHGEGNGPSHLSGMIVRYGEAVPPHVDVGELDIPSDPDDQEKGLAELSARGHALGGDQVIGVTFEHGENGARGHLRGRVIRYTR